MVANIAREGEGSFLDLNYMATNIIVCTQEENMKYGTFYIFTFYISLTNLNLAPYPCFCIPLRLCSQLCCVYSENEGFEVYICSKVIHLTFRQRTDGVVLSPLFIATQNGM